MTKTLQRQANLSKIFLGCTHSVNADACILYFFLYSMKKFVLLAFCLFSSILSVLAFDIGSQTQKALSAIQTGDFEVGYELLNKASATNNIYAQFYMAVCYEHGVFVEKDHAKAFAYYRRVAERGLADGMFHLARCYSQGIGVKADSIRSNEWTKRYNKKGGTLTVPDIIGIYNDGLKASAALASSPVSNSTTVELEPKADDKPIFASAVGVPLLIEERYVADPIDLIKTESDVDFSIPKSTIVNDKSFALIIANENYQEVAGVPNALNDGEIFAEYCKTALGLPSENIHIIKNATFNNIRREVNLMAKIAEAYNGQAKILIYYSGHGLPDESSHAPYLLPVDGFGSDLSTCYSLNDLYKTFEDINTAQTVILLDACFSGSTRGDDMLFAARGVAIKAKPGIPKGNIIVISAAQGDETAYPFKEKAHGLFTYFLLKKLQTSRGNVSVGELVDFMKDNVYRNSLVYNGKPQTPSVQFSPSVSSVWRSWKLNQ